MKTCRSIIYTKKIMPSCRMFLAATLCNLFLVLSFSIFFCLSHPSNIFTAATNETETDLLALLSFKSLIWGDPSGALSSWNSSRPHCRWQGVSCGRRHPDRVTALTLDSFQLAGQISPSLANLTFLQNLNLSNNRLSGSIPEELGRLSRLQYLDLGFNSFQGNIPSAVSNCTNLEYLSLRYNNLGGTIPSSLAQCENLQLLGLKNNFLEGDIPAELGNLFRLEYLHLSNNNLTGNIPPSLGNLTNLLFFNLYENSLTGSIPTSLGQLKFLQVFQINDNQISGTVPHSLYNLSNMVYFDISINYLDGFLPLDMCDVFETLEGLIIYENQFKGQIPSSLANCTTLSVVDISLNSFTGIIPYSIGSLQKLNRLQVESNQLEATTPSHWSFVQGLINCTDLQFLNVGDNRLQGVIPTSFANLSSLNALGLSKIPISGSIPVEFGMLTNLTILSLGHTLLSGKIPIEFGNLQNLEHLYMPSNMLSGEIPSTIGNLTKLNKLFLYDNAFEGRIPPSLSKMQFLEALDISYNKLTGEIPIEIMNILTLSIRLDFSYNHLNGSIPSEIGRLINIVKIDLSYNNLSGQLPNTIGDCQLLQILHLEKNLLHGTIPSSLKNLKGLQELDLSNNSFSGQLPPFLSEMKLAHLNVSFNHFQGEVPKEGVFKNVTAIDIRGNPKLCGGVSDIHLPKCISGSPVHEHHSQKIKIILICIAGVVLCISMTILIYYWRRRSQKDPNSVMAMTFEHKKVSYNDLLRATDSFSLENRIGSGTFGVVYKADITFGSTKTVAVKVLNLEQYGAFRSFLLECEALRNVRHRNLIKILSVCSTIDHQGNDFKALIFEFMPNGSLDTWIHQNACTNQPFRGLTLIQRMNVAIDIAMGLEYLHEVPIVHCDLKPSNVLLDDDMTAHVGDFGLARFLFGPDTMQDQSVTNTDGIKGSIGYIPPEYGMGGQASTQGDVYSYGILLLEMFTGIHPTDERFKNGSSLHRHVEMAFPEQVMDIIHTKMLTLNLGCENTFAPDNCLDCLISVMRCGLQCSKESAKERNAMVDVVKELISARSKLLKGEGD
ncbi:hypothetical protein LUZ61_008047 [Rhynchospora tenuis]|uniref:Receptor kinase-like protein Xa21 n=1 Tax=Rhynchospora tenuis TaxID=198213 RepID=A0AAD5ZUK8_9POAL|nr:hypothetical protein LUZ61_008047 [Rhynchospora tenuis]